MICQHLDPHDFQSCSLVNRVFFHAFQPYLWRTLRLLGEWYADDDDDSALGVIAAGEGKGGAGDGSANLGARERLFLQKSRWIRNLEYDQYRLPNALNPAALFAFWDESRCRHLLELSTTFIDEETDTQIENLDGEDEDLDSLFVLKPESNASIKERNLFAAAALVSLINQNPRLRKCEFNLGSMDSWVLPVLMDPLKRHPFLRELRIGKWTHFSGMMLERLLKHLPAESLEVIWLNWERVNLKGDGCEDDDELSLGLEVYQDEDEYGYCWPASYPAMKEVHLIGLYSGLRGPHIPRFLHRCPNLHTLTWPGWPPRKPFTADPYSFIFNLSHLHHNQGGSFIKHLSFHLGEIHNGIQITFPEDRPSERVETLRFQSIDVQSHSSFLLKLTTRWSDTLTVLEFGPKANVWRGDTNNILRSCSHLTVYKVECLEQVACLTVGKSNSISHQMDATPWACTKLEVLQVGYIDLMTPGIRFEHDELNLGEEGGLNLDEEDIAFFKEYMPEYLAESPFADTSIPQPAESSTATTTTTPTKKRFQSRRRVRKIYKQLAALTRLQTLTLTSMGPRGKWSSLTLGQYYNQPLATSFDMSLESGLYLLKDLSDLQVLNLREINEEER
ncbi:hypothetical protein EC991_000907, partial [Linnemannia zychae]